jgi:hypothetical protein
MIPSLPATSGRCQWNAGPPVTGTAKEVVIYVPTFTPKTGSGILADAMNEPIYAHHLESCVFDCGSYKRIFVSWSQHPLAEDAVGQYVRYSFSDDYGLTWSSPETMFPPPQAYTGQDYKAGGLRLQNSDFVHWDGRTFAMAQCVKMPRDNYRHFVGMLIREVFTNNTLGSIYLLGPTGEDYLPYTEHPDSDDIIAHLAARPDLLPQCCVEDIGFGVDYRDFGGTVGRVLVEPSSILLTNGETARLWRGSDEDGYLDSVWHETRVNTSGVETYIGATSIPNAPSRGEFLRLADGRIVFCGNFIYNDNRRWLQLAISSDELVTWDRLWDLWYNGTVTPPYRDSTRGDDQRGGGKAYPSLLEVDGYFFAFTSLCKQWVICHRFNVSGL